MWYNEGKKVDTFNRDFTIEILCRTPANPEPVHPAEYPSICLTYSNGASCCCFFGDKNLPKKEWLKQCTTNSVWNVLRASPLVKSLPQQRFAPKWANFKMAPFLQSVSSWEARRKVAGMEYSNQAIDFNDQLENFFMHRLNWSQVWGGLQFWNSLFLNLWGWNTNLWPRFDESGLDDNLITSRSIVQRATTISQIIACSARKTSTSSHNQQILTNKNLKSATQVWLK